MSAPVPGSFQLYNVELTWEQKLVQIFTQSPRMWKPSQYSFEALDAYRSAQAQHPTVTSTFCHATYLINLGLARSRVGDQIESVPSGQPPAARAWDPMVWFSTWGAIAVKDSNRLSLSGRRPRLRLWIP